MVTNTRGQNSKGYRIATEYSELSCGILGPLSEFFAVLGPLVTVGGPVTVCGSLRWDEVGILLSNDPPVLGVGLADRITPSGPRIIGGARGRESGKGGERYVTGLLGSRDDGCLREGVVVGLPLIAILGPGPSCLPVSHMIGKG